MLCDQPFVNAELIDTLIERGRETGKTIVGTQYRDAAIHIDTQQDYEALRVSASD